VLVVVANLTIFSGLSTAKASPAKKDQAAEQDSQAQKSFTGHGYSSCCFFILYKLLACKRNAIPKIWKKLRWLLE
jgi:hypothetical protein